MFRFIAIVLTLAASAPAAHASDVQDLSADLSHFISDFDLTDLNHQTLNTLRDVIEDEDAPHGQKVLALHSLLDRHGALGHADMHGAQNLLTASMGD
jgi:hypothetical protein